jgi:WD repeat-containing protein 35
LVDAYYKIEDFTSLTKIINVLPENSPVLERLAEKLQSMGLCEEAVQAYVRFGDVKKAVDCCVLLN